MGKIRTSPSSLLISSQLCLDLSCRDLRISYVHSSVTSIKVLISFRLHHFSILIGNNRTSFSFSLIMMMLAKYHHHYHCNRAYPLVYTLASFYRCIENITEKELFGYQNICLIKKQYNK